MKLSTPILIDGVPAYEVAASIRRGPVIMRRSRKPLTPAQRQRHLTALRAAQERRREREFIEMMRRAYRRQMMFKAIFASIVLKQGGEIPTDSIL